MVLSTLQPIRSKFDPGSPTFCQVISESTSILCARKFCKLSIMGQADIMLSFIRPDSVLTFLESMADRISTFDTINEIRHFVCKINMIFIGILDAASSTDIGTYNLRVAILQKLVRALGLRDLLDLDFKGQ